MELCSYSYWRWQAAERIGLHEYADAYPHVLSGGMLQRVSFLRRPAACSQAINAAGRAVRGIGRLDETANAAVADVDLGGKPQIGAARDAQY
ncbi:hypothetical protein [Paenibacillus sp. sgz302251]|uniref:hypothetical protein n=1 Tax=Paenibacillus sp. sgz302251 TaxID=3414493 RepID=UPI003C7AF4A7